MTQVPEKVLSWLYSVLHEYHDPQRTYSDIARTLSTFPLLAPRTQIYTYESGNDALLLTLNGTLPASFRGTIYHYPLKLHIPHAYPQQVPIVFVDPGKEMMVRPGQHVGVDGRIYHPYLRDWTSMWDRANLTDFLQHLQQVFAKEPPVISRVQQQQPRMSRPAVQPQHGAGANQGLPTPPPKHRSIASTGPTEMPTVTTPPPVPPKPGEENERSSRNVAKDGPPLPPLPHELTYRQVSAKSLGSASGNREVNQAPQAMLKNGNSASISYSNAGSQPQLPMGPLQYAQAQQPPMHRSNNDRSPVSPISPANGYSELPGSRYSRPPPFPQQQIHRHLQAPPQSQYAMQHPPYRHQHSTGRSQPHSQIQPYQQSNAQLQMQKQPPPDLLSDPFELTLPGPSGVPIPAPPIPPNPEKEHLLHAISGTLAQQAQQKVDQNLSAIAPLQAQQQALRATHQHFEGEIRQLEQLEQALSSNEAILRRSIQDCDRTIATTKSKKQPPIDEVLIAPTMVANQLWTLCAEEAACREAMYVLQKAVDRGRVSGSDFVRQMRALGRETFMKMALARKCAQGMGLETAC